MKISKEEVLQTAELARLEFNDEELEKFTDQLGDILTYIDELSELNTDDVEPTSHVLEISTPLRDDIVKQTIEVEDALKNAPEREDDFFVVPKVIED